MGLTATQSRVKENMTTIRWKNLLGQDITHENGYHVRFGIVRNDRVTDKRIELWVDESLSEIDHSHDKDTCVMSYFSFEKLKGKLCNGSWDVSWPMHNTRGDTFDVMTFSYSWWVPMFIIRRDAKRIERNMHHNWIGKMETILRKEGNND